MTVQHHKGWLSPGDAEILSKAAEAMGLQQHNVTVYGSVFPQPRLTAWCCDTGQGYRYSGQETPPVEWPVEFLTVRDDLEEELGREFPCCLVNHYRDGKDSVGWHQDDESQFGANMLIACLSLGGTRRFKVKLKGGANAQDFELANGDLIVFTSEHLHTIPKTAKPVEPRTSLTFRTIETDNG